MRRLSAAEKPPEANTFALLADPHIAAQAELEVRGACMSKNLGAVSRDILDRPQRPAATLINGDCAYLAGLPGDYVQLARLLQPLRDAGLPVHLALGNHDDRANLWAGIKESRAGKGVVMDKHVAMIRSAHANWFLLDTLEAVNKTPGSLGDEQLQWLTAALDQHADKPAILVGHHNPHLREVENKTGLKDTDRLLAVARPRKHVKAYVFGHTHNWSVETDEQGFHFINLPPVGYVFNPARPNGWVTATLGASGIRLELHALDREHPEHGQVKELSWRPS